MQRTRARLLVRAYCFDLADLFQKEPRRCRISGNMRCFDRRDGLSHHCVLLDAQTWLQMDGYHYGLRYHIQCYHDILLHKNPGRRTEA